MSKTTIHFLDVMAQRGFVAQCTDLEGLRREFEKGPVTAYVGFDATADSLHVGHLVSLMSMRWLAKLGHNVIALVGGATTMVGDPSFRNAARPLLAPDEIEHNIEKITSNIRTVIGEHSERLQIVNNGEWLGSAGLINFMRDVGSHFSVSRMLTMDSVKSRLEGNGSLSMLEFTYMMLQSADFLHLFQNNGCKLQMGGSDQWGNIVNGIELVRRSADAQVFGLTTNLLTTASGQKMGKTQNGAVWLDGNNLSPFDFWQFWRNVDDADTKRFLALFTELDIGEVDRLTSSAGRSINDAKITLANEVTSLIHGTTIARECADQAVALFGNTDEAAPVVIDIAPTGIGIVDLVKLMNFAGTSGEVRRLIDGGAIRINDSVITDPRHVIVAGPDRLRLAVGKRKRAIITLRASS